MRRVDCLVTNLNFNWMVLSVGKKIVRVMMMRFGERDYKTSSGYFGIWITLVLIVFLVLDTIAVCSKIKHQHVNSCY